MRSRSLLLCFTSSFGLGVCLGCSCEEDKPYTPFGVASAAFSADGGRASSTPATASASADAGKFTKNKDVVAPLQARTWKIAERVLQAPAGRLFQRALVADFDADGEADVVAWTVPDIPRPELLRGQLWFYPARGRARRLTDIVGFVPTGPGCKIETALTQSGKQTMTLDVRGVCQTRLIPRSPVRGISVIAPGSDRPEVLTLRVADRAPGERLDIDVDSNDRDEDGRDDVLVTVKVQADGGGEPATAKFAWLDRAAGASRSAEEPQKGLSLQASAAAVRAGGKNTSRLVPQAVGNLRRLYASVCAESGTPRLFDADGAPFRCGRLDAFFERLDSAELRAALKQKQYIEAFAVLTRDGYYHTKLSEKRRGELVKDLTSAVEVRDVTDVTSLSARPLTPRAPRYSPLSFDPDGTLLIRTEQGVARLAPGGPEQPPAASEGGASGWPLEVVSEAGVRWTGLLHSCDRSEILLTFASPDGVPVEPLPTRVLAARPGNCGGGRQPVVTTSPLGLLGKTELSAILAGSVIGKGAPTGLSARGTPRSPDGTWLVVPTPIGMLVTSEQKTELWRTDAVESRLGKAGTLTDCVVAVGASAVACLHGTRAVLVKRP
jgi:hypothetical protein